MKLSEAQREVLSLLAGGPRIHITDERTVRPLERRGYAESLPYEFGGLAWHITEAGRLALEGREK